MLDPDQGFINACKAGNAELIKKFLDEDPKLVNVRDETGISAFLQALYHKQKKIAAILLVYGAQLDLFESAAIGNRDLLSKFLDKIPALVGSYSNDGWTPLHLAAFFGHAASVRFLLERKADPNLSSKNVLENTPLHSACAAGHAEVAAILLEGKADPNATAKGWTPLQIAASNGNLTIVDELLKAGAKVDTKNPEGKTALDLAAANKHEAVVNYLKERL